MHTKLNNPLLSCLIKCVLISTIFIGCKTAKPAQQNTIQQPQIIQQINEVTAPNKSDIKIFDDILQNAHVGICVFDVATKTLLTSYQSDKYFIPASNLKIATCYATLKYLGDSLVGLNYNEDDTAIYFQGTGDPTFLNNQFNNQPVLNWFNSKWNKKMYLYNTKFTTTAYAKGWSWDDFEENFMAERNAFPMYENTVNFSYSSGFKTIPKYFENKISSTFEASNNNYKFNVSRKLGANEFNVMPGKYSSKNLPFCTSSDNEILSGRLVAQLLSDTLKHAVNSRPTNLIGFNNKIFSQPKDVVLASMMFNSDNFIAEQLLLMVSNELLKEMDENKLIQYLLNNDFNELPLIPRWVDASGLSRYNLFSPNDLVFILNKMKTEFGWQRISKIFPKGNEGTLKNMFLKNTTQVYAKSGTLSNTYCLSGYLIANSGKEFIFSIIVNHHQLKTQQVKNVIENYLTDIIEKN